jgi:hypothetical protein
MAYRVCYLPSDTASDSSRRYVEADTVAELPTGAPYAEGDLGSGRDADTTLYRYDGATWQAVGGSGSGVSQAQVLKLVSLRG